MSQGLLEETATVCYSQLTGLEHYLSLGKTLHASLYEHPLN